MKRMLVSTLRKIARTSTFGINKWRVKISRGESTPRDVLKVSEDGRGIIVEGGILIENNKVVFAEKIPQSER